MKEPLRYPQTQGRGKQKGGTTWVPPKFYKKPWFGSGCSDSGARTPIASSAAEQEARTCGLQVLRFYSGFGFFVQGSREARPGAKARHKGGSGRALAGQDGAQEPWGPGKKKGGFGSCRALLDGIKLSARIVRHFSKPQIP